MTWETYVDGVSISPKLLEIKSPYGQFMLGLRPEGFHGWAFKPGKEGVLTVPWVRTNQNDFLIGLIHEWRPNMGSKGVWSVPGGFVELNELNKDAAKRETSEESGLNLSANVAELPGEQVNPDRMYYILEDCDNWPPKMFSLELPFDLICANKDNQLVVRSDVLKVKGESELIFFNWREAVRLSRDGLSLACISRLLATLL